MAFQTGPYVVFYDTIHLIQLRFTCIQAYVTPTYTQILNTTCEYTNLSSVNYYNFGVQYNSNAAPLYLNPSTYSSTVLEPGTAQTNYMAIQNNNYNPNIYTPAVAFAFMWSYDPTKNTPDQYFGAYTNQLPNKGGTCPSSGGGTQTCGLNISPSVRIARYLKPKIPLKKGFLEGPVSGFWDHSDPNKPFMYCPNIELEDDESDEDKDTVVVPVKQQTKATKSNSFM